MTEIKNRIESCSDCTSFLNIRRTLKDTKRNAWKLMKTDATIANKNFARSDSLKRHLKLHEVSRSEDLRKQTKRLNSSPSTPTIGIFQTPAAKDREITPKVALSCLNTFETYTISTDLNFVKNLNGFLQNSQRRSCKNS
ncbi:hypothetical protein TNCV_4332521 [Trichonephila clavipes]|nr:hypothetical protein TNCV_4332521 [Trichonephila clavipes]